MRALIVLGPLNAATALWLATLEVDCVYHFSAQELSLPTLHIQFLCLANPQIDALTESAIVENCIERHMGYLIDLDCDINLMRRALRLSELRLEARSYLNALELVQRQANSNLTPITSLTIVSHYLVEADTSSSFSSVRADWLHVPHSRFLGLMPGMSWFAFKLATIFKRFWPRVR